MICSSVIRTKLLSDLTDFQEFPVIFADGANSELVPFDQDVTMSQKFSHNAKFEQLYIPGHARLDFVSKNGDVTYIQGPQMIVKLEAFMLFWNSGERFTWDTVQSYKVTRVKPWLLYLHDLVSHKGSLYVEQMELDTDKLFETLCPNADYRCECFNTHQAFAKQHPETPVYVNLLNPNCHPQNDYIHSKSLIGTNAEQCKEMLNSMLTNKTLLPWEHGGQQFWECGNQKYPTMIIADRTKRLDDHGDKVIERQEMPPTSLPEYFVFVLLTFVLFIFICAVFALLRWRRNRRDNAYVLHVGK